MVFVNKIVGKELIVKWFVIGNKIFKYLIYMIEFLKEYFVELFGWIEFLCSYFIYVINIIIYEYEEVKRNLMYLCVFDFVCFFGVLFFFYFLVLFLEN